MYTCVDTYLCHLYIVQVGEDIRERSFKIPPVVTSSPSLGTWPRSGQVITTHPLAPHISFANSLNFQFSKKFSPHDLIRVCVPHSIEGYVLGAGLYVRGKTLDRDRRVDVYPTQTLLVA